jgi:hypothetical protein
LRSSQSQETNPIPKTKIHIQHPKNQLQTSHTDKKRRNELASEKQVTRMEEIVTNGMPLKCLELELLELKLRVL